MATLRIPLATYRIQFNHQFRFEDAQSLVDYFDQLGITDIYSSPLLQAQPGSLHGYDVTDPTHLNFEIGSEEEFEALVAALKERRMGLLLDIVPNHMAAGSSNPWWMDVLEDGPGSAYASFFDIDWHPPRSALQNKVLLPILGRPFAEVLENQELRLEFESGGFVIRYFDNKLPAAPKSYLAILQHRIEDFQHQVGAEHPDFKELGGICAAVTSLPDRVALTSEMAGVRRMQREALKERLGKLYLVSSVVREFIDRNLRIFNGHRRRPGSFVLLDRLLASQAYVLTYWLSTHDEINYRRFFAITNLVGVRVEDPLVFDALHAVTLRLVERGLATGLRIDHVDGLRDPHGYLRRLQERAGGGSINGGHPPFYVVVEKILGKDESLPGDWPICGSTGYDALNVLTGLFVDAEGCKSLRQTYESFLGSSISFQDLVYEKKKQVMESLLAVEMRALGHHLILVAEQDRYGRDLPRQQLASALTETTACFPVYRTYVRSFLVSPAEQHYLRLALDTARRRNPNFDPKCFEFISDVLLLKDRGHTTPEQREARLAFITRWQQFTGPIMAKGLEDSALYVYNCLTSLNEVGGAPDSTGIPVAAFHEFCLARHRHGHSLTTTSTHDTKRAEDVRARINVLSEIPETWQRKLQRWSRSNRWKKDLIDGVPVPDANDEVLLYQTMLGAWPLKTREVPGFRKRLQDYVIKAAREAMVHTKWSHPNHRYEKALIQFVKRVTRPDEEFLPDFLQVLKQVSFFGALNSLAQLLLKITIPGVPDIYQGSELWDFRLVDPDNRNPVDFGERSQLLQNIQRQEQQMGREVFVHDLVNHWQDGRIKLYVLFKALSFRRQYGALFLEGAYRPLTASGPKKENVVAFMRQAANHQAVIAVPRWSTRLFSGSRLQTGESVWGATMLELPKDASVNWVDVLTGQKFIAKKLKRKRYLPLGSVFAKLPIALLANAG